MIKNDIKLPSFYREGWESYEIVQETIDGKNVVDIFSFPSSSEPSINFNHVDGPLLTCRDGSVHWLTYWERFQLWIGYIDINCLDRKYGQYHKYKRIA